MIAEDYYLRLLVAIDVPRDLMKELKTAFPLLKRIMRVSTIVRRISPATSSASAMIWSA